MRLWQGLFYRMFLSSFPETQQHYRAESVHRPVYVFVTSVKFGETIKEVICSIRIRIMDNNRKQIKTVDRGLLTEFKTKRVIKC
jgi:hypothetical protein